MQKGNVSSNFSSLECAILERPCCLKAKEEEENPAVITVPKIIILSLKKKKSFETAIDWMNIHIPAPCQVSFIEILTPQCDGALWEVMRSWGWGPCEWGQWPHKRPQRAPSPILLHEDTVRGQPSTNQEVGPLHQIYLASIFDFPASRTVRNERLLVTSLPAFGFSVRAAQMD